MKSIYSYALLGALFAVGAANAATTTTIPVGYTTTSLVQGFNLLGVTLQQPILVSSTVSAVSTNSITVATATFGSLTAGTTYIIEVTGGKGVGTVTEGTVSSATVLTTTDNLSTVVDTTSTFQVRKAATLEDLFGTTASILVKATSLGSTTNADFVWVPTATPGTYNRYYLSSAGAWKSAADNSNQPNVPIVYLDGMFVQKKSATPVSLTLTGEVKKVATSESLVQGFNLISTVYPVGVTLQNSGLATSVVKATSLGSTTNADFVWVPTATPGTYNRYYLSSAGAWKSAADNSTVTADVVFPTGIFVQKKAAAAAVFTLTPPTAYASL